MENLKDLENFGLAFKEDEDSTEEFFNELVSFIERRVFNRISKRVNFLLTRINDSKVETVSPTNKDKDENGNWRTRVNTSGDFVFEKRVSGAWVEANKISGS